VFFGGKRIARRLRRPQLQEARRLDAWLRLLDQSTFPQRPPVRGGFTHAQRHSDVGRGCL
jgi:hypothetical protein